MIKQKSTGYFAYGGSTVIAVFPNGSVQFDEVFLPCFSPNCDA